MSPLSYIFDEKNLERKKGKIYGRIYRRKLVLNQAMQQVNFNLHTKYKEKQDLSQGQDSSPDSTLPIT